MMREHPSVQHALADLAARLGVAADDVELLEARNVTWRSSALGCPKPDEMYMQVLTPGMLIRLRHADREFTYHRGSPDEPPFLCATPEPPLPGVSAED